MKKRLCFVMIIMGLFLISNVLAYQSTITVKTGLPNQDIAFKPADPDTGKAITTITETADSSGKVVFNYNLEEIRIKMGFQAFNQAGNIVNFLNGKAAIFFPNVILDDFVDIDLNQAEPTIKVYGAENESENVTTEEEEGNINVEVSVVDKVIDEVNETKTEVIEAVDSIKQESQITGFAIVGKSKEILKSANTYYIVGGLIILLIAIILFKKKMRKKGSFNVTKLSEMQKNKEKIEHTDDEFADAERKLKEAKEELDALRDKKKNLREAQERLRKDQEALKKLESDEDENKNPYI